MSAPKGSGAAGGDNKDKKGGFAKAAGALVAAGIAFSLVKVLSRKNEDDEIFDAGDDDSEDFGSTFQKFGLDAKEESEDKKYAALGVKGKGFGSSISKAAGKMKDSKWPFNSNQNQVYEIAKGDTLWGISQKYGVTVDDLKVANGLFEDAIYAGDELLIPK